MKPPSSNKLLLDPIGIIRTPFQERYRAPRQPRTSLMADEGEIILDPGCNYEQALADLTGFDYIWVIFWFDRNTNWRPKVRPPRGDGGRRGLFATRSPHRPNPIGLSLLRLLAVKGRTLRVGEVDMLDCTPVLDIKPYLPSVESHPDARAGWLDEIEQNAGPHQEYELRWNDTAREQREWLIDRGIDLASVAERVLSIDPSPHPYRRVAQSTDGGFTLAVTSWRIRFTLHERVVTIHRIESGYARSALEAIGAPLHDEEAHRAFHIVWDR